MILLVPELRLDTRADASESTRPPTPWAFPPRTSSCVHPPRTRPSSSRGTLHNSRRCVHRLISSSCDTQVVSQSLLPSITSPLRRCRELPAAVPRAPRSSGFEAMPAATPTSHAVRGSIVPLSQPDAGFPSIWKSTEREKMETIYEGQYSDSGKERLAPWFFEMHFEFQYHKPELGASIRGKPRHTLWLK